TLICVSPASFNSILIILLFASILFSINSLTTEAGLSTTSPAAILFANRSGSCRIFKKSPSHLISSFSVIDIVHSSHLVVSFLIDSFLSIHLTLPVLLGFVQFFSYLEVPQKMTVVLNVILLYLFLYFPIHVR